MAPSRFFGMMKWVELW